MSVKQVCCWFSSGSDRFPLFLLVLFYLLLNPAIKNNLSRSCKIINYGCEIEVFDTAFWPKEQHLLGNIFLMYYQILLMFMKCKVIIKKNWHFNLLAIVSGRQRSDWCHHCSVHAFQQDMFQVGIQQFYRLYREVFLFFVPASLKGTICCYWPK